MNDASTTIPCPCESGLPYDQCCGTTNRTAVNADILATLSDSDQAQQNGLTTGLQKTLNNVGRLPDWFPARINFFDNKAFFVKMSPHWYRESVFLDPARIKGTCVIQTDLNWLRHATDHIPWQSSGLIFHTAFCGSTLMAQALDALFDSLPLREPEVLSNVLFFIRSQNTRQPPTGDQSHQAWLERVMRLLSRRYEPQQAAVIKANDYANPLMIDLLNWRNDLPVLFMYTPLEEFLAGCLKADNRKEWIRGRYKAIPAVATGIFDNTAIGVSDDNSFGEMAAVYWAFNIALYRKALTASADKLRSLDFNTMLNSPLESIQAAGKLFGLRPLEKVNLDAEIHRLFDVYSKNSKFKYSPQQRNDDIQRVLENHPAHRQAAERLARSLLKQDYPDAGLPADLLA